VDEASGASALYLQHPGDYGGTDLKDITIIDKFGHALVPAWRGDNAGPHGYDEAQAIFAKIRGLFPHAKVFASSFENYFGELQTAVDAGRVTLPRVTQGIEDTWIYGTCTCPCVCECVCFSVPFALYSLTQ
jgi:hypothetical protein